MTSEKEKNSQLAGSLVRAFQAIGKETRGLLNANKVSAFVLLPMGLLTADNINYLAPLTATFIAVNSNSQMNRLSLTVQAYNKTLQQFFSKSVQTNEEEQLLLATSEKVSERLRSYEGVSFKKVIATGTVIGGIAMQFLPDMAEIASYLIKNISLQNIASTAFSGLVLWTNDRSIRSVRSDIADYAGLKNPEHARITP
ncbi:MAG: hypothetical protein AAF988_07110 [Pseudomonadota bacterium]